MRAPRGCTRGTVQFPRAGSCKGPERRGETWSLEPERGLGTGARPGVRNAVSPSVFPREGAEGISATSVLSFLPLPSLLVTLLLTDPKWNSGRGAPKQDDSQPRAQSRCGGVGRGSQGQTAHAGIASDTLSHA